MSSRNVFIERFWRSLKYEAVYLHELTDRFAAQRVIARWMVSTSAEAYQKGQSVEVTDKPCCLPAPPPVQSQPQDVVNRFFAA